MVSPAGSRHRTKRLVTRSRFTILRDTARLICVLLFIVLANTILAQDDALQIELVAETNEGDAIIHVRLPRGQSISEAFLTQGDLEIQLNPGANPLPISRFILLDTSAATLELQQAIQSNISRFWSDDGNLTSLTFYSDEVNTGALIADASVNNNRLANYSIDTDSIACHGDALAELSNNPNFIRDYDRSWRILLITTGDFSGQENCTEQDLTSAPSMLDVLSLREPVDQQLIDLVESSGGQIYYANLLNISSETANIVRQWGQSTYALEGNIPDGWDSNAGFELEIVFNDDSSASAEISFMSYSVPVPATATPTPTLSPTPLSVPTEIAVAPEATQTPQDPPPGIPPPPTPKYAFLLIIGAILFVVGAVVLALALSRVRRVPVDDSRAQPGNFYETLHTIDRETENSVSATRVRERNIVAEDSEPQTQLANLDDTYMAEDDAMDDSEAQDELLVTQVLTDERFQKMMEQSVSNDEIVGWMRLQTDTEGESQDYELTKRGAVVGRSQECDIQITGDRAISRQHARLEVRSNGQVTVSRLSAVNPVIVGGVQISNRHPLAPNDVIHLSDETRLIFIARGDENTDTGI